MMMSKTEMIPVHMDYKVGYGKEALQNNRTKND